jgi:hypothetical protein
MGMEKRYQGKWTSSMLNTEEGGTWCENHSPLHFRGMFLPVSLARKVLFCTFKFLFFFETLPDRKIMYTDLNWA